ncbi:MAG: sensor histidine kinase, partial [Promethearchaeota archaeon]
KLKELDQIRNDLITRVSHELRTPLVSICGATELLLHYYNDAFGVEELELIEMVDRGSKRLKYLVNNLIDISRLKHKKLALKKQRHDLTIIIRECVKDFHFLIKEQKIDVTLNLPDTLFLNVDRLRIGQVFSNLLSNAIKNTPPYGKIQINLQLNEDGAKISITDTGIGLTKDEIERLFTRFGKIERYGQEFEYLNMEGAGLGLYLSKEIVNLHGGQIWVESLGRYKGSTFVVKLPSK